jgi:hypothetical protein
MDLEISAFLAHANSITTFRVTHPPNSANPSSVVFGVLGIPTIVRAPIRTDEQKQETVTFHVLIRANWSIGDLY